MCYPSAMTIKPNSRYGRLVVISRELSEKPLKRRKWLCRCDCGKEKFVTGDCLREGKTKSCGCLRSEVTSARTRVHGMRHSPEFGVWSGMRNRCNNPNNDFFASYGARGIKVCDRWQNGFAEFYADMGPRPSPKHTIERLNNDGNYEPSNCKWAVNIDQANNRRSNRFVAYRGMTLTVRQLMAHCPHPISHSTLRSRLYEKDWSVEDAVNTPVGHPR